MLAEKTLEDVADMAIRAWLSSYDDVLYEDLDEFMYDRDIPEGDGAENVIAVEQICKTKLAEMRKVLGGTDD